MNEREDYLIQGMAADGTIRISAAITTNLANEACGRHGTMPTASAALGRTLTGALLLGNSYKDLEYITIRFECRGEIGAIVAEANAHGTVRGYVKNPLADAPRRTDGKLDVGAIVGQGLLHVIRETGYETGLMNEPYFGMVPIVSGEIAEDLTHYLAKSEQVNSAMSLGVFIEPEQGRVTASGGYLLQVMPGISDKTLAALEAAVVFAPPVTEMIRSGADAAEMIRLVLGDIPVEILKTQPVEFRCKCSYERSVNIVAMLGKEEVRDMLEKDKGADLTCHFCSAVYHLDKTALDAILNPPRPIIN